MIPQTQHLHTCVNKLVTAIENFKLTHLWKTNNIIQLQTYTVPGWSDNLSDVLVIIELKDIFSYCNDESLGQITQFCFLF